MEPLWEDFRMPAVDGQEPKEADARLVELAKAHWDRVVVKEGETTTNFMFSIRMRSKCIGCGAAASQ